jgi:hypothetical protein
MDFLGPVFAGIAILAFFEVFAARRHNEMIKSLKLINDALDSIQDQTDTQRTEKLNTTKELARQEFSPIAEFIDDKFTKTAFVFTRSLARTQLAFIRDFAGRGKGKSEEKRVLDDRASLEEAMANGLTYAAPEKVAAYIKSLPRDELRRKFNTIMRGVHMDML